MKWQGQVYIDPTLPFGLRSAPLIFSAVADAAMWVMMRRGVSHVVHYIDDFLTIGGPDTKECAENNTVMHEVCEYLGLPKEPAKDEGPMTSLSFTGIEIDSEAMELRLPKDKLARLLEELSHWRGRKACKKRDLLSLIGLLAHASKVVRAGRTFLRRLIDLSMAVTQLEHFVRLNQDARSDIEWWYQFSSKWNGITMLQERSNNKLVSLTSDASGSWGCGAYWGTKWFMLKWSGPVAECHITTKELVPIVMATALWGEKWRGQTVQVWCDNAAAVSIVNHGLTRDKQAMHLTRCLAYTMAKFELQLEAAHIRGTNNAKADALSRNNVSLFRHLHPQANKEPTAIPEALLDLLIVTKPDWMSQHWSNLWTSIF